MRSQGFARHALVYALGSLLLHAAGVLLVPLYTRLLSPEEFGMVEIFNRVGEVVTVCLLLSGLRQAIVVMHGQSDQDSDRQRFTTTAVVVVAGGTLTGGMLMLGLLSHVQGELALGEPYLLYLAVVAVLLEAICMALLVLSQLRLESVFFVIVSCGHLLVRVTFCILFVGWLGWGVAGVVVAALVTSGLFAGLVIGRELWRAPFRFDLGKARAMLRYALPLAPCGLCFFLLNNGDRFFVLRCAGEREVGLYAFGYKLAAVVPLFSRGPLMMVWGPRMFELARQPDAAGLFGRAFTRILATYVFVGLGLCLLADEAIAIVGGSAFGEAVAIIAPVVLAYFFLTAADLMDSAFFVRSRVGLKTCATMISTTVALALYAGLIPLAGGLGAAWATLGAFACHALVTRLLSRHVFPVRWEPVRIVGMLALAVGLWLVSRLLPSAPWAVACRIGLWALWPVLLWTTGLVSPAEKQVIYSALGRLRLGRSPSPPAPVPSRGEGRRTELAT